MPLKTNNVSDFIYCTTRAMGEKFSLLGEDFSLN